MVADTLPSGSNNELIVITPALKGGPTHTTTNDD